MGAYASVSGDWYPTSNRHDWRLVSNTRMEVLDQNSGMTLCLERGLDPWHAKDASRLKCSLNREFTLIGRCLMQAGR